MIIKIDMNSDTPVYRQITNQILLGAASGKIKPGEKLPTVRNLAADIGVNPMTVSKAYSELKSGGIILADRRKGAVLNPSAEASCLLAEEFEKQALRLALSAKEGGISKDAVTKIFNDAANRVYEGKGES